MRNAERGGGDRDANEALSASVEARRQLDKKYLDKIDSVLRAEQVGRLPATTRDPPRFRASANPDWDREGMRKWLKDEQ